LPDNDALEKQFAIDYLHAVVLHEEGHDFGLQHNFIGSMAYHRQAAARPRVYGEVTASPVRLME